MGAVIRSVEEWVGLPPGFCCAKPDMAAAPAIAWASLDIVMPQDVRCGLRGQLGLRLTMSFFHSIQIGEIEI